MIEQDRTLTEIIDFYQKLKADTNRKPGRTLKERIAKKIPAYSLTGEIYLYPLKEAPEPRINGKRLAADSESRNLISKLTSKTFADEDKEYMIKVLNYETQTKVFVFSMKNEIVKNFDIIIGPQDFKYHFKDNSEPLLISEIIDVNSIRIEFT